MRLWARPDADNSRSLALLDRAGFSAYVPVDAHVNTAYLECHLRGERWWRRHQQ
ncbi:hypothetical protein GCM10010840_08780 [Deinococcus aerolatus]|uniref:Uncharacterized protein n=1 Tax=Deinococcus aerolatus TaxID=522487 RepID=A0ABQ2G3Q0_9DEIO|nr:hypothetical protein GCM10010840_08780 [Deinococcus aerolatus]